MAGREVARLEPGQGLLPGAGLTKLDLVDYYLAVAEGALRGIAGRPMALKRYVNGADGEFFFQKRAPESRPEWIETVELRFPSGRTARRDRGARRGAARVDREPRLHRPEPAPGARRRPRASRRAPRRPRPDARGSAGSRSCEVALRDARGARPSTGSSAGPRRRARAASTSTRGSSGGGRSARCGARRSRSRARSSGARRDLATSKWWKEERHGVFLDYNQNAKDRTVASAYSVRPTPDARVSTPLTWDEVPGCDPAAFTVATVPERFAALGDPWAGIDDAAGSLEALLALAERDEAAGLGDAPWPPHYEKTEDEPPRVQPSKRRAGRDGEVPAAGAGQAQRPDRPAPDEGAARGDRARGHPRRGARRARAMEGAPSRGRAAPGAGRRAWSTRCAAAARRGPGSA